MSEIAIIIGAGPAGLTAALELLKHTDIHPVVFEASDAIGGISRTIQYKGNRMDIGGHRFFSKNDDVMNWWQEIMLLQGAPALDDILLERKTTPTHGPNPETTDNVMLIRNRVSRILYQSRFFDYPITPSLRTFRRLGFANTLKIIAGYLKALCFKREEKSLEDFYINRFGYPLYKMFFEDYTQKVWGIAPANLGADWGEQRIKGLSIKTIIREILTRPFARKSIAQKERETSLIEQFLYPKYGPGQLWEQVAMQIEQLGGEIHRECKVVNVHIEHNCVKSVVVAHNGILQTHQCNYLLSSMPLSNLVDAMQGIKIPDSIRSIAQNLPYRDFISIGLLVNKLNISNNTKIRSYNNRVPDTWIYIQEKNVRIGRIQIFNNWSPYMVHDYANTIFLGLEYFCSEGDELWRMSDDAITRFATNELVSIELVQAEHILDSVVVRTPKAYPSYHGSYCQLPALRGFLNSIENLYCIGRNGQHRYNNMDHSMLTAMECVRNIQNHSSNKNNIWDVNTEKSYHEAKESVTNS